MTVTTCSQCGHENPDSANFCSSCGTALPRQDDTVLTSAMVEPQEEGDPLEDPEDLPAGAAMLVVRRGPNAGSRFLLEKDETTIGRHPDSDVFLDDITVSRRHAEITITGAEYIFHDTGSLNGTYINNERAEEQTLVSGDEIQIGRYLMAFVRADTI